MPELRQIQASDHQRVGELFARGFDVSPPPPIEYVEGLCCSEPEGCFVLSVDGEVVGYASSHRSGRIGYLGNLAVHSDHRGKGYGKAVTNAARDLLTERCDVVGLAVEPDNGRNLGLYTACGFVPTLPSCMVGQYLPTDRSREQPASVRTARQLGDEAGAAIEQIGSWSDQVLPGLDFTRDLEHFVRTYPDDLFIHFEDDRPRGFLAYHELFRGDPWCAVRPGPKDAESLDTLIAAVEAAVPGDIMQFHFHTNFRRVQGLLKRRGYRVDRHKTCMVIEAQPGAWPANTDALFVRPWWS